MVLNAVELNCQCHLYDLGGEIVMSDFYKSVNKANNHILNDGDIRYFECFGRQKLLAKHDGTLTTNYLKGICTGNKIQTENNETIDEELFECVQQKSSCHKDDIKSIVSFPLGLLFVKFQPGFRMAIECAETNKRMTIWCEESRWKYFNGKETTDFVKSSCGFTIRFIK